MKPDKKHKIQVNNKTVDKLRKTMKDETDG